MTTRASLDAESVRLTPGVESVVPVQIRNDGDIVEGYQLEVIGIPAQWARIDPPYLSLYPGTATTAAVAFRPPADGDLPAGEVPFGIRVVPSEHPDEAVVPEGVLEILPLRATTAEVQPRTSRGRRTGRHRIAVDNRGNTASRVQLTAGDPEQALRFRIRPSELTLEPGTAAFATVRVQPVRSLWRGMPISHQYRLTAAAADEEPTHLDATYLQEPRLPSWLGKAVAAAIALALIAAGIWYQVLKPTIDSAARQAVEVPVQQAARQANQARSAADQAVTAAGNAQGSAADAGKSAQRAGEIAGTTPPPRTTTAPTAQRLRLSTANHTTDTTDYTVKPNDMLEVTDVVLQNPQGDFGRVTVQVDGRILLDLALENFRDTDYHFITPVRLTAGQRLILAVRCNAPGRPPTVPAPSTCDTAFYFGGVTTTTPKPAPTRR